MARQGKATVQQRAAAAAAVVHPLPDHRQSAAGAGAEAEAEAEAGRAGLIWPREGVAWRTSQCQYTAQCRRDRR